MIEIQHATKWYGRRGARPEALADVSVSIPRGSVWAVVGPNGAGKSTLLSLILGFVRASRGSVELAGMLPRDYLRERGAGYLPERFTVPASWRAGDSLRLHARLERLRDDAADRAAALFELGDHLDKRADALSRGLLQRLGLAQAVLGHHEIVVLDEPTEGLDPVWRIRFRDIIASLRADGCTILIASHDLAEVERIADHALLLDDGRVRDVLEIEPAADAGAWDLAADATRDAIAGAFPGAEALADGGYRVRAGGAAELSERLAVLITLGGIVRAVQPVRLPPLEARVRAALDRKS